MVFKDFSRWLQSWKDALAGKRRKRHDEQRRRKTQLELEQLERREVTNDIMGLARNILAGVGLGWIAQALVAGSQNGPAQGTPKIITTGQGTALPHPSPLIPDDFAAALNRRLPQPPVSTPQPQPATAQRPASQPWSPDAEALFQNLLSDSTAGPRRFSPSSGSSDGPRTGGGGGGGAARGAGQASSAGESAGLNGFAPTDPDQPPPGLLGPDQPRRPVATSPPAVGSDPATSALPTEPSRNDGEPTTLLLDSLLPVTPWASQLQTDFGRLPLIFEANQGQTDPSVQFLSRGKGHTTFLTRSEAVLVLAPTPAERAENPRAPVQDVVRLQFPGANTQGRVDGLDELPSRSNYFVGHDRSGWTGDIPNFAQVAYRDLFPGIDVVYHGADQQRLQFDFLVAPNADVGAIQVALEGVSTVHLNEDGSLTLRTAHGEVVQRAPILYQTVNGVRQDVSGSYRLLGPKEVGFQVGDYNRNQPLVIDPVLDYGSYLGGSGADQGNAMAVDLQGNLYVTGATYSSTFPTSNPYQSTVIGADDVFVTKLSATGGALIYSTYLGGTGDFLFDRGKAIAVDAAGNAYVAGDTDSYDFPTTAGAFQSTFSGDTSTFVTKLSAAGNALVYSTFLGGGTAPNLGGIAVDATGAAYVTGQTSASSFPTTAGAFDTTFNQVFGSDAFVTKFRPDGSGLQYSTFLGGTGSDYGRGIALDPWGNAYVVGNTSATNFPTASPYQSASGGGSDTFLTKLNADGSALSFSTYLGGTGTDDALAVAVNAAGQTFVTGLTQSSNFPTTSGVHDTTLGGSQDAFVTKFDAAGSTLSYSTYLGGTTSEEGTGIAVDIGGVPHVTGWTSSTNFPTVSATQSTSGGSKDAFLARLNSDGTALLFATYLGGSGDDQANGLAVDLDRNSYLAGTTASTNFPTASPYQGSNAGNTDAFVAQYTPSVSVPVITAISSDSGVSATDFITTDPTLTISGTSDPSATVTVSRAGIGVLGTTSADGAGAWSYDYTGTTLAEGTHAFSATSTVSGTTGPPSVEKLITVDLSAPTVTLWVDATTYDTTPEVRVTLSDIGGVASNATVTLDVDLNNDNDFLDSTESGYKTATLSNGWALFEVTPALAVSTVKMRTRVTDKAGNEGTSSTSTVVVASTTSWTTTGTVAVTSPFGGDPLSHQGALQLAHGLDLDLSPGTGQSGNPALVFDSRRVDVKPIIQATVQSDSTTALPSTITATLTWDGTAVTPASTFSTTGKSPGDLLVLGVQVPTAQTTAGRHRWQLDLSMNYGSPITRSVSGTTYLVPEDNNPYGSGWNFAGVDRLYTVASDAYGPAGQLRAFGAGGWAFYQDTGSGNFTEPTGDNGTLSSASGGGLTTFTYETPTGEKTTFNNSGLQVKWLSADGVTSLAYSYTDGDSDGASDDLNTQTNIDGSLATFTYASNKLQKIDAQGPRTVTLTHSSGDLTTVKNPDNGLRTLAYDGSHHPTSEQFANLQNSWAYSNNALATITWGTTSNTTLTPAMIQGISSLVAGGARSVLTDPVSRVTRMRFDSEGRMMEALAADGGLSRVTLDAQGRVITSTDPLNRTTTFTRDAQGFVTQEELPDNALRTYQYQSAFHALTTMIDERGNTTKMGYDAGGHLVTVTNAKNEVTTFTWDNGLLKAAKDPLNHLTTFSYDSNRRLESVKDALGNLATTTYDGNGNVRTTVDQLGRTTTFTHDAMGRTTQRTDAAGGLWTMVYNGAGLLTESRDALNRISQKEYNDRGLVTKELSAVGNAVQISGLSTFNAAGETIALRDANGNWTYTSYDPVGRVKTTTDASGGIRENFYDLAGQVTASRDDLGRLSRSVYNARGWMTTSTDALNKVTSFGYDAAGNRTTTTNPLGKTATVVYDELGRPTVSITPLGFRTTTAYDAAGNVSTVTDPRGIQTKFEYDELNRRVRTIDAFGTGMARTATMAYDKVGNTTESIDPLGHTITSTYDALNRQTTVKDQLGHVGTTVYNAVGNTISVTDALNKTMTFGYDALNRRVVTTDPLSHTATVILDAAGQQAASVDALGQAPQSGHDVEGRPLAEVDELWGLLRFRYDQSGNIVSLIDPVGNETGWVYDTQNRKVKEIDPAGETTTWAYDAASRVSSTTDRLGRRKDFTYDDDGRLTNEVWVTSGGSTANRVTYTYDSEGHKLAASDNAGTLTFTYDDLGRMKTQTDVWSKTLTFTYDASDRRTEVADPFGGVLTSLYDDGNKLMSRKFGGVSQTPLRIDLTYNNRNELTHQTRYSDLAGSTVVGTSIYTRDDFGRLTALDHKNGAGTVLASYVYAHDNSNRLTSETVNGGLRTFSYDRTDQLTNDGGTNYTFDANGNRTISGYQTTVANRMTNDGTYTYTYDDAGNTTKKSKGANDETWTYSFDNNNRLTGIEKRATDGGTLQLKVTYTYDAVGNRVQEGKWKTGSSTTTTRFAYDGSSNAWADLDGNNALATRRLFLDGTDQVFARISAAGTAAWYLTDHLNSVRDIVDGSGGLLDHLTYSAYLQVLSESSPVNGDRYTGTGRERDSDTGLQYNRARYYDPTTGRWMTDDPIKFEAGDPNLYRYVKNNPTSMGDPSGLQPPPPGYNKPPLTGGAIGGFGAIGGHGYPLPPAGYNRPPLTGSAIGGFSGNSGMSGIPALLPPGLGIGVGIMLHPRAPVPGLPPRLNPELELIEQMFGEMDLQEQFFGNPIGTVHYNKLINLYNQYVVLKTTSNTPVPDRVEAVISMHIQQLGSLDFQTRGEAQSVLTNLYGRAGGYRGYRLVGLASQDPADPEIQRRSQRIMDEYNAQLKNDLRSKMGNDYPNTFADSQRLFRTYTNPPLFPREYDDVLRD